MTYVVNVINIYSEHEDEETFEIETEEDLSIRLEDVAPLRRDAADIAAKRVVAGGLFEWKDDDTGRCVTAWRRSSL